MTLALIRRHRSGSLSVAICLLSTLVLGELNAPAAQPPAKVPRIGWLTGAVLSAVVARTEAFRQGLRELGYVEGENIVIEWRSEEGNSIAFPRSSPS